MILGSEVTEEAYEALKKELEEKEGALAELAGAKREQMELVRKIEDMVICIHVLEYVLDDFTK